MTLIELMVVAVIILVVVYLLYGTNTATTPGGGVITSPSGEARTRPGAALEQARGVECQQNLQGLRQAIAAYRLDNDEPPPSLADLRATGITRCPVSGNPYVYDPATGTVRCTTPGHENF